MNVHTTPALTNKPDELAQAPHVLAQLVDLLNGTLQPTPEREEQIAVHLAECTSCQLFVELSLLAIIKDEQERDKSPEAAQMLLTRWSHITHTTWREEIPLYVEAEREEGEQAANARFPVLAGHLPNCQDCRAEVRDLHSWLDLLESPQP